MKPLAATVVGGTLSLLALALASACQPAPRAPRPAKPAQEQGTFVPGVGTFGCVTANHFCPNRFDPDLRQERCDCQGEPGRFKYHPAGR